MGNELGDGAHGEVVLDDEHVLQIGEPGDGCEVLRLVTGVLQEDVVRGVGLVRRQHEGVPVGLGLRDLPGADRAGAAADVLDDGTLAERSELRRQQPRERVDPPARRVGYDDPEDTGGKALREDARRRERGAGEEAEGAAAGDRHAGLTGFDGTHSGFRWDTFRVSSCPGGPRRLGSAALASASF
jgi:hypothetical protein